MPEILTLDDICVVIVNYRTPDLLETAATSFREFYPDIELTIIDNGSRDESLDVIDALVKSNPARTKSIALDRNHFHGPAMDRAMRASGKEIVFFLDSDTKTVHCGFLELMVQEFNRDEKVYGVGRICKVNKRGFATEDGKFRIILSPYMMLRRKMYFDLPPFKHHGMPTLENFSAAPSKGYQLVKFDIAHFIKHRGRGTASRFGYGLGLRGVMEAYLNKFGL